MRVEACFVLLFIVSGGSACSVVVEEDCYPVGPVSETACLTGTVLRGSVIGGASEEDFFDGKTDSLNVTVLVTEVLKAEDEFLEGLQDEVPFQAVVTGFQPCCACGTEPPESPSGDEEYFFFVAAECMGSCTSDAGVSRVFKLSPEFLGTGKAAVTDASRAEVAAGIETSRSGESCDVLYCQKYPQCRITKDCASIISGTGAAEPPSSMASPRDAVAWPLVLSLFLAALTALVAFR